jgi:uncharacterized protein YfaS (alpha-2-macroglobulin family)
LDQAYRLYTLALANQPEMGAMNRLRETPNLNTVARWQLAATYRLAGLPDAGNELVAGDRIVINDYTRPGFTFGSNLRDRAIVLNAMLILNHEQGLKDMVDQVSTALISRRWYSTHSTAFSLLAMARFAGTSEAGATTFEYSVGEGGAQSTRMSTPIHTVALEAVPLAGSRLTLDNTSERTLFATVAVRGTPRAGMERASASGLSINVTYTDPDGRSIDIAELAQGEDFVAEVSITNQTGMDIDNIALSHIVASGWEIHNTRLDDAETDAKPDIDYEDIRDDRIYRYFGLKRGETKRFSTLLNAAYLGRFYLPGVSAEAMYDATKQARTTGQWVEVSKTNP